MNRHEWFLCVDRQTVCRRAGGRRRYNAMRRRKAEARRAAISERLGVNGLCLALMYRGATVALAAAFGVHRTTAWRDLQAITGMGPMIEFVGREGETLFTVRRAYRGGPVVSVTDADGYEIRGAERRNVMRQMRLFRR